MRQHGGPNSAMEDGCGRRGPVRAAARRSQQQGHQRVHDRRIRRRGRRLAAPWWWRPRQTTRRAHPSGGCAAAASMPKPGEPRGTGWRERGRHSRRTTGWQLRLPRARDEAGAFSAARSGRRHRRSGRRRGPPRGSLRRLGPRRGRSLLCGAELRTAPAPWPATRPSSRPSLSASASAEGPSSRPSSRPARWRGAPLWAGQRLSGPSGFEAFFAACVLARSASLGHGERFSLRGLPRGILRSQRAGKELLSGPSGDTERLSAER